jgi:SAM-dependent methyltransferase
MSFFTLSGRPTAWTNYRGINECALPGQHEVMFKLFAKSVATGSRVLDLASGGGAWPKRLADFGYSVTACDIYPEVCQVPCKRVDLNRPFSEVFGTALFDAVTAIEMLEHLENQRHIFREANKVLPIGGKLMLSTPNASGLHSRLKFLFTGRFAMFDDDQYCDIGHIRPLTYWEIEKSLTEAGFAVQSITFHNHYDAIPRTVGEIIKRVSSIVLTPLVRGVAGGQPIIVEASKTRHLTGCSKTP